MCWCHTVIQIGLANFSKIPMFRKLMFSLQYFLDPLDLENTRLHRCLLKLKASWWVKMHWICFIWHSDTSFHVQIDVSKTNAWRYTSHDPHGFSLETSVCIKEEMRAKEARSEEIVQTGSEWNRYGERSCRKLSGSKLEGWAQVERDLELRARSHLLWCCGVPSPGPGERVSFREAGLLQRYPAAIPIFLFNRIYGDPWILSSHFDHSTHSWLAVALWHQPLGSADRLI